MYKQLRLENQLCFPIYAASRLITRAYQPMLKELGITYPQYLVLMVLWESDQISVNHISQKLILNTNTITPLLKRMESHGLIQRSRSDDDERVVIVTLTQKGKRLQDKAATIPEKLIASFDSKALQPEEIQMLKSTLNLIISLLSSSE